MRYAPISRHCSAAALHGQVLAARRVGSTDEETGPCAGGAAVRHGYKRALTVGSRVWKSVQAGGICPGRAAVLRHGNTPSWTPRVPNTRVQVEAARPVKALPNGTLCRVVWADEIAHAPGYPVVVRVHCEGIAAVLIAGAMNAMHCERTIC